MSPDYRSENMAKILVADDNGMARDPLSVLLANAKHEVFAAIERMFGLRRGGKLPGSEAGKPAENPAAKILSGPAAGLVLIADDDPETRAVLRRFLATLDCETIEAEDGPAALELARARRPDIVLLDVFMPKKNGVDVLKELAPEMPRTGFIMVTGNEDEEVARECLESGAFDYVSKPVNIDVLGNTIKARLPPHQ
ncbi:MAG: hypothetical protein A2X33_07200 [Elusimicrobia bacterium GWA2_51_34]|nr:MAG: hypothetical protein A2X33_07200 [Elusimicrobia bacterium GWA2_51_34]